MNATVERKQHGGASRELMLVAAALATGLALLPPLVWATGTMILGPYPGGLTRLWSDYLALLRGGSTAAWILLLGPYALLSAARLLRRLAGAAR